MSDSELLHVLLWAFRQNFHADHMNASIHCAQVRYSPITFRFAEQIQERTEIGNNRYQDVWTVILDKGHYEEDRGR